MGGGGLLMITDTTHGYSIGWRVTDPQDGDFI